MVLIFLLIPGLLWAQEWTAFNQERLTMTRHGMLVLGTWAASNLIVNPILASQASGSRKYFFRMNAYWNVVNLAIAGIGYYGAAKADPNLLSLSETISEQHKIEKLLLFNAGLDLAYVLGGLYLRERSKNTNNNPDRLKGFGESIILQGAWLFAFDMAFYLFQRHHGVPLIEGLSLIPSPVGLTLAVNF